MLNYRSVLNHCPECNYAKDKGFNGCCIECPNYSICDMNEGTCKYINECWSNNWRELDDK